MYYLKHEQQCFIRYPISDIYPFVTLPNLGCPNHECLWVKLRPYRLPREISCIIAGVLYNPPLADNNELYGLSTLLSLWTKYYYNTLEQESSSWATLTSLTLNVFAEIHLSNKLLRNQPVEKRLWI